MSKITQQNASSSEELAATAEQMAAQTAALQDAMSFFRTGRSSSATAARTPARIPSQSRRAVGGAAPRAGDLSEVDDSAFERF